LDLEKVSEFVDITKDDLDYFLKNPLDTHISSRASISLAEKLGTPLHPSYTYYWDALRPEHLLELYNLLEISKIEEVNNKLSKIIIPVKSDDPRKRYLELLGMPHFMATEDIIIEKDHAEALLRSLGIKKEDYNNKEKISELNSKLKRLIVMEEKEFSTLEILNKISGILIKDKSGTFIGARMGRPEKAKMRKLIGAPHVLFPVGEEGGRMRSFQSVLEKGKITSSFALRYCNKCKKDSVLNKCDACGEKTEHRFYSNEQGVTRDPENNGIKNKTNTQIEIDFRPIFKNTLKLLGLSTIPDMIKGVKGTSNKDHIPEHFAKGVLRAHHDVAVNKDGTTRYDMSEMPITHFKPNEVGTPIERLIELGYNKDIKGNELTKEDQLLELKPQDLILPAGHDTLDNPATTVLTNVCNFIDDLLIKFYKQKPYYNLKDKNDLVGQLVIGLAPHISAGMIGRIIGFSQTATFLAHPLYHAAMRRDCDGDEACVMMLMDALLNFSRQYLPDNRGGRTMDAPLVLTAILNPAEVDDMVLNLDVAWKYPLEFYEASQNFKLPWDVDVERLGKFLGKERQYERMGFTHDVTDINQGSHCSAYKTIPSIQDKLKGQMFLAKKIRAVETSDVARLVIEKHFMKDTRGNLRKFSMQKFRCPSCNESYRRPPLIGKCTKCGGRLIFTISQGSIVKYLEPSISLAENYNCDEYLKDSLYLIRYRIEQMFAKDKEKQEGLGKWFG